MTALVLVTLALLRLGLTASAFPQLPVLYLREPGSDLKLDPRIQREAPAFYVVDPARFQREVLESSNGSNDDDDENGLDIRPKRKTPLSFLFFEQDNRSQRKPTDLNPTTDDADSEVQQDFDNRYSFDGREASCNSFACNSKCLATSRKQNGGRCQANQCVCSERKSKKRPRKNKQARKPTKKLPM